MSKKRKSEKIARNKEKRRQEELRALIGEQRADRRTGASQMIERRPPTFLTRRRRP